MVVYIQLLDELLRTRQAASRADRLHLITLRYVLLVRREIEELAATPKAPRETTLSAARFARKAQSGFSTAPLPAAAPPRKAKWERPRAKPARGRFHVAILPPKRRCP